MLTFAVTAVVLPKEFPAHCSCILYFDRYYQYSRYYHHWLVGGYIVVIGADQAGGMSESRLADCSGAGCCCQKNPLIVLMLFSFQDIYNLYIVKKSPFQDIYIPDNLDTVPIFINGS